MMHIQGDFFQEDLFPPTYAGIPSHTADEWLAGSDKEPVSMSLDPAKRTASDNNGPAPPRPVSIKSQLQLQKEVSAHVCLWYGYALVSSPLAT